MKVQMVCGLALALAATALAAPKEPHRDGVLKTVSLTSLLGEMSDWTAATRVPEPMYLIRSWSSYDRKSIAPDRPGWFANDDWNNFIRFEGAERVMVDAKGPGAVVRVWCAGVNISNGVVRIYLDGAKTPTFAFEAFDLCGGTALCGEPFSFVCAVNASVPYQCGRNLMLAIPYAKSCKVTFEPKLKDSRFWYNVETRTYAEGTAVETLTPAILMANREAIAATGAALLAQETCLRWNDPYDSFVPSGESISYDSRPRTSAAVVRGVKLRIDESADGALSVTSALEQVEIEVTCDGVKTIAMPLGAFFGTGPCELKPFRTRLVRVTESGELENMMPMPYRKNLEIKLFNRSDKPVCLRGISVCRDDYDWIEGRSMYLTANYVRRRGIPTVKDGQDYDLRFDEVSGKGVLVGTMVFVDNPSTYKACPWWGEGDEKVWVDGEPFPSVFGTGTEDYFNYAWSRPEPFSWPFCAQPSGAGNLAVGKSANFRWRALDAVPFAKSLLFDMEMWHWDKKCKVDYDSASWRYLLLGGTPAPRTFCNPLPIPDLPRSVYEMGRTPHRQVSDPTLYRENGKWYVYPSAGLAWSSADDGGTWKAEPNPDGLRGQGPTMVKHKGRYFYMPDIQGTVYEATKPEGPWKKLGVIPIPKDVQAPADAMLFSDDDGRLYFYWGCSPVDGIWGCELDADNPCKLVSAPKKLIPFDPVRHPWERHPGFPDTGWLEGAWMMKVGKTYVLVYSAGGAENASYAMGAYRSDSPLGEFHPQKNNPFFVNPTGFITGTGHGSLVKDERGDWWISYCIMVGDLHRFERRIGLDRIMVGEDGEIGVAKATDEPQWLPKYGKGPTGWTKIPGETSATAAADGLYQTHVWMFSLPATVEYAFRKPHIVRAFRICWREGCYDPDKGINAGPVRYRVHVRRPDGNWQVVCDASENDRDLVTDYRETEPLEATAIRLEVLSAPKKLELGLSEWTVFGTAAVEE